MIVVLWILGGLLGLFVYLVIGQAVCRLIVGDYHKVDSVILIIWPIMLMLGLIASATIGFWSIATDMGDRIAAKLRRSPH